MRFYPIAAIALAATLTAAVLLPSRAQEKDVFAFIPEGGRTLLTSIFATRPPPDEIRALLTGKRTREEWTGYLKEHTKTVPALAGLGDKEVETLADYLAFTMPLAASQVPTDLARADWGRALPMDGRDYALEKCQGCHIITVVITQNRPKEHWLGTMNKPSHIGIRLNKAQREQLASWLVLNAGIPIDQVPEELRAGGASY
jgi:hypothetical protein